MRGLAPASADPSVRPALIHCPLCRSEHFTYQFTHAGLPIVKCDGCSLLMRNPQPSDAELSAIYGDDYFFGTGPEQGEQYANEFARLKHATASAYLDRVERYLGWDATTRRGRRLRAGLACATGDFVLIQDADLEYDIEDYAMLLEPLRTYRRAFVLGIRHGQDGQSWKMRHFREESHARARSVDLDSRMLQASILSAEE